MRFARMMAAASLALSTLASGAEVGTESVKLVTIQREQTICIPDEERNHIESTLMDVGPKSPSSMMVPLLADPMGSGGTYSSGKPLGNYVDLGPGAGLLDYNCGMVTYEGHDGLDIGIADFYDMDEGVPCLSAATGVVVAIADGNYDRNIVPAGQPANYVVVRHSDGSYTNYIHLKKYSVQVSVSDTVQTGDTLGMVGSSGNSSGPHIHFSVKDAANSTLDPFNGPCRPGSSLWQSQGAYIMDRPFELFTHGVAAHPVTSWAEISERPPSASHVTALDTIYSWINCRSVQSGDILSWELYENGNLWTSASFTMGANVLLLGYTYWYLPAGLYGSWEIRIKHNGNVHAQQFFTYDATVNTAPISTDQTFTIDVVDTVDAEFVATDSEGPIFWYVVSDPPTHGTLTQDGGRKRKFRYIPQINPPYIGADTVTYYAIDGDSLAGPVGRYIFNLSCTIDSDGDGLCNGLDNCPTLANFGQEDEDSDGMGDGCDLCPTIPGDDADGDGDLCDVDNCPNNYNPSQFDADGDGLGNACDPCAIDPENDADGDGRCEYIDNCDNVANSTQEDSDADSVGNACDNCPSTINTAQADVDGDNIGDLCDNCPSTPNTDQANGDSDALGDACDPCPGDVLNDSDGDAVCGSVDNCPNMANASQADSDLDGIGDVCDNCVALANPSQANPDGDTYGTGCDNCPNTSNPTQTDTDGDGLGNQCDACPLDSLNDQDGDASCGEYDNCPTVSNPFQDDSDFDGVGDACDNCLDDPNPDQADADSNGIGNVCDCSCTCHGNPVCDAAICDVLDVVSAVTVAFRNGAALPDPNANCPHERTDVDCSTFTDVIDVVKIVTVAFRNGNPATEFCNPCP